MPIGRPACYTGRVLKGAKTVDLPVLQSSKYRRTQSGDAATNTLVPIAHVEVDDVGREGRGNPDRCSCERHVAVSTSRQVSRHRSLLTLMAKGVATAQSGCDNLFGSARGRC